jgi:mono/diheme cytochrome c family protein
MTRPNALTLSLAPLLIAALAASCSPVAEDGANGGDGDTGVGASGPGGDGDISIIDGPNTGGDFSLALEWPGPEAPQLEADAPAAVDGLFAGAAIGEGCVTEPQAGTMIPRNWLRPRFRVAGGATAYMVVLSSDSMSQDLVGYGGPSGWSIPLEYWQGIAKYAISSPITVTATVRAHNGTGFTESVTSFDIAPVDAGGAMVYWASNQSKDHVDSSRLEGFSVGEEGTVTALVPAEVSEGDLRSYDAYQLKPNSGSDWSDATGASPGKPSCIGCHTSTPDGAAVAFNDGFPWAGVTASIEEGTRGQRAVGVTDLGARLLSTPFIGTIAFSPAYWSDATKRAVATFTTTTPYNNAIANLSDRADLVWINLAAEGSADFSATPDVTFGMQQGTGWGTIARTGDVRAAANPAWNAAGDLIAYASVDRVAGSHIGGIVASTAPKQPDSIMTVPTEADLYTVPFNDGAGGTATPVTGASDPGVPEYYPDFSPDGSFLAYNRAGSTDGYIYYRPDGEVNVIPVGGGERHRLAANDPPLCSGEVSPGVINSWPKWGPSVTTVGGSTYYWIIFSSGRAYPEQFLVPPDYYTPSALDTRSSQLYLAAVVVDANGAVSSYPGLYVWNQTANTSNLTPAWDEFKIPPVPVR